MLIARFRTVSPLVLAMVAACGSGHERTTASGSTPEASARDGGAERTLAVLARQAVDVDEDTAAAAIDALRGAGPAGLAALLAEHREDVVRLRTVPLSGDRDQLDALREEPALLRLRAAIDHVAAQRDAFASELYWYTDLEAARAESDRSGRPILSLRLLGRLDEEASCANSRFFRWLLYPSPIVREALAAYVLHWSSERPAPHVTIDMGDGRTIERTVTGNSIHYVLDASGRVIDAIAGLHTPTDFADCLRRALAIAAQCGVRTADRACLARAHAQVLDETRIAWEQIGAAVPSWETLLAADIAPVDAPDAVMAMPLTVGKMAIEMPLLDLIAPTPSIDRTTLALPWGEVARATRPASYDQTFSEGARALERLKTGAIDDAALLATTYARTIEDSARNRFTLDRRIHAWLAVADLANDFSSFNERVYAELFLTPASDPWLGLRAEGDWDVLEVTTSTGTRN